MNEIQLYDIKGLVAIPDYSFYFFIVLMILGFALILSFLYFLIRHFKNKNSQQKNAYNKLENISFDDSKKAAYEITLYAKQLVQNDREKKLYEELIEELEQYKYKKVVEPMRHSTKEQFERFMDAIDVK